MGLFIWVFAIEWKRFGSFGAYNIDDGWALVLSWMFVLNLTCALSLFSCLLVVSQQVWGISLSGKFFGFLFFVYFFGLILVMGGTMASSCSVDVLTNVPSECVYVEP